MFGLWLQQEQGSTFNIILSVNKTLKNKRFQLDNYVSKLVPKPSLFCFSASLSEAHNYSAYSEKLCSQHYTYPLSKAGQSLLEELICLAHHTSPFLSDSQKWTSTLLWKKYFYFYCLQRGVLDEDVFSCQLHFLLHQPSIF